MQQFSVRLRMLREWGPGQAGGWQHAAAPTWPLHRLLLAVAARSCLRLGPLSRQPEGLSYEGVGGGTRGQVARWPAWAAAVAAVVAPLAVAGVTPVPVFTSIAVVSPACEAQGRLRGKQPATT